MNRHQRRANAKLRNHLVDPAAARTLEQGLQYQKAGRLAEAEGCYRRVLAIQPNHADALQLVGGIACQAGQYDIAAKWISRAIEQNPNVPAWFSNLGLALERQGKLEDALASYDKALELRPAYEIALSNRGNVLKALGRTDEALASYDKALALNPDYVEALNNRSNVLKSLGRLAEALAGYDKAIGLNPTFATAFNGRGMILRGMKRAEDALASYDKALALSPDLVDAHNNRGAVLAELMRFDEALLSYDRALALNPNLLSTLNNRGNLLQELDRVDEALADYEKALSLDPSCVAALNGRGNTLRRLKRLHEAEKMLQQAIKLKPDYAEAYCNLGKLFIDLGKLFEAESVIRHAAKLKPDSAGVLLNLGRVLIDLGRLDEAEDVFRRSVLLEPNDAKAHYNLGVALGKLGKLSEAEEATRCAIALKPNLAQAYHNLSVALTQLGRLTEAQDACKKSIELAPLEPLHFRQLGEVSKFVADSPHFAALDALSKNEASLSVGKQTELHFAMAKAHADVGQVENEFRRLLAGNKLKRSCIEYNETATLGEMDRAKQVFTAEFIRAAQGSGEPSSRPIFIMGMPRSGTTLIEQILASHPRVFGAGELKLFESSIAELRSLMRDAPLYPEIALHIARDDFRRLGANYLAENASLAPPSSHVTDKMPANFLFAGLIHLALPNATIIHAVRDPVDTCVSCFSKLFVEGNFQTYDLAELGRYYRHYEALMAHWHRVLPPGRILDVRYEDLVANLEGAARRIVAHCNLQWDERCLEFHRTKRAVRTASAAQVRKPIYASSIGRWRAYQAFLAPLLAELSNVT
jgi:tetratricopeptide (TPR) repeat protein